MRSLLSNLTVVPVCDQTATSFAEMSLTMIPTLWAIVVVRADSSATIVLRCISLSLSTKFSVTLAIRLIVSAALSGYLPTAVSPESITASVKSIMALATSETSALVATGLPIILCNI